jgi:hypothetical protein
MAVATAGHRSRSGHLEADGALHCRLAEKTGINIVQQGNRGRSGHLKTDGALHCRLAEKRGINDVQQGTGADWGTSKQMGHSTAT